MSKTMTIGTKGFEDMMTVSKEMGYPTPRLRGSLVTSQISL